MLIQTLKYSNLVILLLISSKEQFHPCEFLQDITIIILFLSRLSILNQLKDSFKEFIHNRLSEEILRET